MRKNKFSSIQISKILKEFDNGKSVEQLSREHGVSSASFYKSRSKYAGMNSKELKLERTDIIYHPRRNKVSISIFITNPIIT